MTSNRQLCIFSLGDELFGIEVNRVQEVLRSQQMTAVTLAPRFIRGLINLRGQIVMAIDLRQCLELSPFDRDHSPMNLVVRTEDGPISFLVDRIHDVVDVTEETFEGAPPNLHGVLRKLIRGTYPLRDKLLLALDVDALLNLIDSAAG